VVGSIWLVPRLFGPNGTLDNATAMSSNDDFLVEKLAGYWAWAGTEPKITGIIPWHWSQLYPSFQPKVDTLGGNQYPKTLAWIATKVAELPRV
jgi:hypothetical protein